MKKKTEGPRTKTPDNRVLIHHWQAEVDTVVTARSQCMREEDQTRLGVKFPFALAVSRRLDFAAQTSESISLRATYSVCNARRLLSGCEQR